MVQLNINIGNKLLYSIITVVIVLTIAGVAIAYNSGTPQIHGHDANEIANLPSGTGGGGLIQVYDSGWQPVASGIYFTGQGDFSSYGGDEPDLVVLKFSQDSSDPSKDIILQMTPSDTYSNYNSKTDVAYNSTSKEMRFQFGNYIGPYLHPYAYVTSGDARLIAYKYGGSGGSVSGECRVVKGMDEPDDGTTNSYKIIDVPEECKNNHGCLLMMTGYSGGFRTTTYVQHSDNKFITTAGDKGTNGDSTNTVLLNYAVEYYHFSLYEDYSTVSESSSDKWVVHHYPNRKVELEVCPL